MSPKDETLKSAIRRMLQLKRKKLRPSTYIKYCKDASLIEDAIGKYGVCELMENPKPILDWLSSFAVTKNTINNRLIILKATYDMLSAETFMKIKYPLSGAKIDMFLDIKKSTYKVDPYSLKEVEKILSKAGDMKNYWETAFFTGMRPSELRGLKWEDVGSDEVRIRRGLINGKEGDPKTEDSIRSVKIVINGSPTRAKQALKRQRLLTSFNDYIFVHPVTGETLTTNYTQNNFKRICLRAGVVYRNQYQTRHSFASNMLLDHAPREWLAQQMGHKDTSMITKTYGKWIPGAEVQLSGNYISQSS